MTAALSVASAAAALVPAANSAPVTNSVNAIATVSGILKSPRAPTLQRANKHEAEFAGESALRAEANSERSASSVERRGARSIKIKITSKSTTRGGASGALLWWSCGVGEFGG